jgi:putative CocE/NonD family hydrolase
VQFAVEIQENTEAQMRDGTTLRADVFRPAADEKFPVLISRTPYDKTRPIYQRVARFMATQGYICVLQDIRGRYRSDGSFHMARNGRHMTKDAEDGFDSIEWAAGLPGSDGKVCIWGHSYSSWSSWMAAPTKPPHLVSLFGSGMAARILDNTRGILETGRRLHWMYQQAADTRRRDGDLSGPENRDEADLLWYDVERYKWIWFLPLGDIPDHAFSSLTPQLKDYMRIQDQETWGFDEIHPDVEVPTCSLTGWYDRIIGAIEQYEGMEANGPEHLRGQHQLIVGPWGHGMGALKRQQGVMDFGPEAETLYEELLLEWCDLTLKRLQPAPKPPVRVFIMGENRWHYEQEWPPERAVYTEYFLHSAGTANTLSGDGVLSVVPPEDEVADSYAYDPRDPVMSLMSKDVQMEPRWQTPNDHRQDVLVYQTPPLDKDIQVTGPVRLILWAGCDAPDTDFTAKLIDVDPEGRAVNVTYGILRCRFRNGFDTPASALQPGESYELNIALNPTGILFREGHRIRLDVSSSDFPNFDRNHNTGRDFWSDVELLPAQQTVFHDKTRPSRLILPVIPR